MRSRPVTLRSSVRNLVASIGLGCDHAVRLKIESPVDTLDIMTNLPELTELPRFKDRPDPDVTAARIESFTRRWPPKRPNVASG